MSSAVFSLARGTSIGTGITDVKRIEDSVRVGRNALLTAVTQTTQFHYSATLGNAALEAGGYEAVPFEGRLIGYLAPSLIAFCIKKGVGHSKLRNTLLFIQDHLGLLCQLAAVVSSIALIAFGHLYLAIASLAFLGIGFLDRMGLLPESLRHPLHEYSPLIRVATGIIVGDIIEKLFAILSLVTYCYEKYMGCIAKTEPETVVTDASNVRQLLTLPLLQQILDNEVSFELNAQHIQIDPLPTVPDTDPQNLLNLFDAIDWTVHLPALRAKFANDIRFVEIYGHVNDMANEEIVNLSRSNLQTYIHSIMNRHIAEGEIHDYDRIQNYLKIITNELQQTEDEIKKTDALIRLSVEGGLYCGPGKFHVAEELFSELALGSHSIPTETKVLIRLQDTRTQWFQAKYANILTILTEQETCMMSLMKWLFDFQDLHLYNIFLNLHGQPLGLRKASADNDHAAMIDPMTKSAVKNFTNQIQDSFKEDYTTLQTVSSIQEAIGHSVLPRPDIYSWWANWIDRQEVTDERKQELIVQLQNAALLGRPMQEGDALTPGAFNRGFLKAMALDMGILKISA